MLGYWRITNRGYLHRTLLNAPRNLVVDHINGDRSDNRKENLRLCTSQQNSQNAKPHKDNKYSNHKGVSYLKSGKRKKPWRVRIHVNRREVGCGYFETEEEAIQVANEMQEKYHKEFKYTTSEIGEILNV